MDGPRVIPISDLLRRRRPISGAVSLPNSSPPLTSPPPSATPKTQNPTTTTTSATKILKSLPQPSIIVGILSLPNPNNSPHLCFSFSDDSGSLCCDILDFDIRMIRRKIRVIGWNFIPFKQCGGLLEIISWEFLGCSMLNNNVDSLFPLVFRDNDNNIDNHNKFENDFCDKKSKFSVFGVLGAVSPVSLIPVSSKVQERSKCTQSFPQLHNEVVSTNVYGFILQILCCDCGLCNCVKNFDDLGLEVDTHSFCKIEYVYVFGISSASYPLFSKVIGSVILLVGLRKKLVYIGKEEARLMFVSTKMTCMRVLKLKPNEDSFQNGKVRTKGKGELGMYVGVVRSTYMQGMVVKLDKDVWLLITDDSLILPHSIRVGSILSVKNVHIVNPKFLWGKVLILGACCKTNIRTISFSPLEARCQPVYRSQSLLGTFVESLDFSIRLWVLMLVQCLRKKLSGTFSEKEILGTNHKEGLVQTYARFILPSYVLQSRHGIFVEFCKHDSSCSGSNFYDGRLSLTMPFSSLIHNCEMMGIKSLLQMNNGPKILEGCTQIGPFREKKLSHQPIRRILLSKDIGVSLLGNLKICPASGRLQYIDSTGSIDAVIPDIPSDWDLNAIYEVFDYSLVLEGRPEMWGQLWMLDGDFFSCDSLFGTLPIQRRTKLTVYVHFSWGNVCCRHFTMHPCLSAINGSARLDHGTYHLLRLSHKFPLQPRFYGDLLGKSRSFAEVMVLPWDLNIGLSDGAAFMAKTQQNDLGKDCQNGFSFKGCKTHQTSSSIDKIGLCCNIEESKNRSCDQPISLLSSPCKTRSADNLSRTTPVQFPCMVTGREIHGQSMDLSAILCFTDGNSDMLCSTSSSKVLLEFNSENFFKYKFLQIGGIYIIKHFAEKCLCDSHHVNPGRSMFITSETIICSLSFHSGEAIDCASGPCNDPRSKNSSASENLNRFYHQNEVVLNPCSSADYGTFSDVALHAAKDVIDLLDADMGYLALKNPVLNLSPKSTDICSIDQQVGWGNNLMGCFEERGTSSGNCLPKGNLISLQGTVVSLYDYDSRSIDKIPCSGAAHNVYLLRFNKEKEGSIYLLVLTDGNLVQICGCISTFNFPIGLGPGAVATFHRILAVSGQNCFMLTPVSFITVNSAKEIPSPTVKELFPIPNETVASCLISDLSHCDTGQPRRFRCSIVAIYFVMLDRNKNLDKLLSHIRFGLPVLDIPLAGFILDDGSSHCCCWTNGERAATFLKLHEEIPQARSGSSWRLKAAVRSRAFRTPYYQLDRILKQHGRVCVKNYGSIHDNWCQDLQLSVGSDDTLGNQDENLLKFILFNACSTTCWNVIGHAMDFDAVNMLEKNLLAEHMTLHALQNVWARDVCQVDALAQAKTLFQDL